MKTVTRQMPKTAVELVAEANAVLSFLPEWELMVPPTSGKNFYNQSTALFFIRHKTSKYIVAVYFINSPPHYECSVHWPETPKDHSIIVKTETKQFNVNFNRGPKALADAIVKRVVPHLKEVWHVGVAELERLRQEEADQRAAVIEVANLLNVPIPREGEETVSGNYGIQNVQVGTCGKRFYPEIRLGCDIEFLKKFIEFMKQNNPKR